MATLWTYCSIEYHRLRMIRCMAFQVVQFISGPRLIILLPAILKPKATPDDMEIDKAAKICKDY